MSLEVWTVYVAAVLVLMSTPGPSQLLMLSNSATNGFRRSLATAAGDLTANAMQMLAVGVGLAAALTTSAHALLVIKWLGVAYLIWLGMRMMRKAGQAAVAAHEPARSSLGSLWWQGFVTSASNPKAIVFFAALFPQFIDAEEPFGLQFAILSITYIVLDGLFLSAYGIGAHWLASRFRGAARAWVEPLAGGLVIGAAVMVGLKTIRQST